MSHSVSGQVIPENQEVSSEKECHVTQFLALPTRRIRTISENERIATGPINKGTIESFCRNKGHGFIKPLDGSESIFLHISDIEGEWIPKEGDVVSYKKALMPPKMVKHQAVHVNYIHLKDGIHHEQWETPKPNLNDIKHLPSA